MLRHKIDVNGSFEPAHETQTERADLGQIVCQI